eukprot:GEMP01044145.1.p1 GENE.GEMP01044145.1~~GEMP01044145.1.p1  ORF type:complete len:101 (+),score=25.13 GEMP01044145.1:318-620(+)
MAGTGSAQSSGTPFNHLRMEYPETFKLLRAALDKTGAPTQMNPPPKVEEKPRSEEDTTRIAKEQQQKKSELHALTMLVGQRRNPFGRWYEGIDTTHKICR